MIKRIKAWFSKKITLIIAPSRGSRSLHIHLSYPFVTFLSLLIILIFTGGAYITEIYFSYVNAIQSNQRLVREKDMYSKKVEETLDLLQDIRKVETKLKGMLGMKNARNVIENYSVGGTFKEDDLSYGLLSDIYDQFRFKSNVNELKREVWEQNQSIKNIDSFILRKRDMLLSTPSIWPIFGYLTSGFGWRTHPITRRKEFHKAIDMYNPLGKRTPIRATARGKVVLAGWAGSFGRMVIIDHGNGFSTRYAHCSNIIVKQGDQVVQGQIIAFVGKTGLSTGNHLHYEVWYRGKPINPMRFVKGR